MNLHLSALAMLCALDQERVVLPDAGMIRLHPVDLFCRALIPAIDLAGNGRQKQLKRNSL